MRILITNDDGITAPGLSAAEDIARQIAGPDGEIWVVAPAIEQSGVGHCISYIHPMRIEERGHNRFAVEGAPADCVLAGLDHVLKGKAPDLLLSEREDDLRAARPQPAALRGRWATGRPVIFAIEIGLRSFFPLIPAPSVRPLKVRCMVSPPLRCRSIMA